MVINKLNLQINSGEITALVGHNGAGKTTLIRLISGIYKPDSGKIEVSNGSKIGVLLGGDINLYGNLTGYEIIKYFGLLNGLTSTKINERINILDDILKFSTFIKKRAFTYSRGMKQKIGLVISIIHDPDILLLDEPSTGLDLEAANDVITFIKYLKSNNKTILIATHNIFEISDLSDNIAFISKGKINDVIATKEFFENCPPDEKNAYLIQAMKGGLSGENSFNGSEKRIN